ncbi:MAG: class I SAM-dependent methyltransferase [DPANN group archaeon]|nr:class I SAM-dependent methyltransferase [DPANN group archaeon]
MKYSLGYYKIKLFSKQTGYLDNIKGKTVFELGAGSGGFTRFLLENGAKVKGIEISEKEFKSGLDTIDNKDFSLVFGDARSIDTKKVGTFDILINDLYLPPRDSIEITSRLASNLKTDGLVIHVLKRDKINMGNYDIIFNSIKDNLELVDIIRPPTGNVETYFVFKRGKTNYSDYLSKISNFIRNMLDTINHIEDLNDTTKGVKFNFSFEYLLNKDEIKKKICPFVTSKGVEYILLRKGHDFQLHTSVGNRFFDV